MTCLTHIRHLIDVCRIELQYFGHLMQTADSMEKNLMLGRIAGRRRRARQKMRLLDGITNLMDMILSKLQETVKDREAWCVAVQNSKDLTETEEIKVVRIHRSTIQKRSYHDRVVTHLESHNLECEVKWALASIITIKASEGDGIPVELLQIL